MEDLLTESSMLTFFHVVVVVHAIHLHLFDNRWTMDTLILSWTAL